MQKSLTYNITETMVYIIPAIGMAYITIDTIIGLYKWLAN